MDDLGDRMKGYENIPNAKLINRMPVIVRIDGRAFHTVTKGFAKPFDDLLIKTMQQTTMDLCEEVQNCRFGYVQSDEISLLIYPIDLIKAEPYFYNRIQKICSITASIATMSFYKHFMENAKEYDNPVYQKVIEKGINFDSRCFNIPLEEVNNYFIWRQQDATRNSIQMVAQSNFSHSQLQNLNTSQLQEKLFQEKGINWNNYPIHLKRGTACKKIEVTLKNTDGQEFTRNKWTLDMNMPVLTENRGYIDV